MASQRGRRRRLLQQVLAALVELSCSERHASGRTAAADRRKARGSGLCGSFHAMRQPQTGGGCRVSAVLVLPFVWALATERSIPQKPVEAVSRTVEPQMAFYRKYTEAMLRRYVRMSMEAGKVPSLLGQEMFRSKVTSYRVESFEDVVNLIVEGVVECLNASLWAKTAAAE